jgi:UDP-N-acetylmuramoyl-tripeptide--D-alanyl-D-alanine ligase
VPEFSSSSLTQWTGGRWTAEPVSPLLGFCVDSRQLQRGQVFVAIKTDKRDGHDFIGAAEAAGAAAAIVAVADPTVRLPQLVVTDPLAAFQAIAREHRRAFRGKVVGISGSAGKTSTKDLLALLLGGETCGVPAAEEKHPGSASLGLAGNRSEAGATAGRVLATEGNLNNHLGVPLTLTRIDPAAHDFAVVEAGISAPGEMSPLAEMIEPDVALITLIAPAHTADLGGLEGVAREKARLPAATRTAGVAVFTRETADYPAFRELGVRAMIIERADVLRPAEPPKDTVYFTLTQRAGETAVALAYGTPPPIVFTFRRVSDGMAQNAVLAICSALWLGVPAKLVQERLQAWQPAKLRGEVRREKDRLLYLDCYNANPASMADALAVFDAIAPENAPRLYVIGSMEELGTEAPAYHRALGRELELRPEDQVFVIGTHAQEIREGAVEARDVGTQVHIVNSAATVAPLVQDWRGAIFVKGSRRYQLEKVLAPSAHAAVGAH